MSVNPTLAAMLVDLKGGQHKLSTSQSTSSLKVLPISRQGTVTALRSREKHFLALSYITIEFK